MAEPIEVRQDDLLATAERIAGAEKVGIHELALSFEPSWAVGAELLVEGETFYPRMQADIEAATHSVHINQFGYRPGSVGDGATELLCRKAREGVTVRLVVDAQGSRPYGASREMYEQLAAAGVQVVVNQGLALIGRRGLFGPDQRRHWNGSRFLHIDHRKLIVVDGRVGYVGGAGFEDHFEDKRFHDLFVRMTGDIVRQFQLVFMASFRSLGGPPIGEVERLFLEADRQADADEAVVLHNAPGFRPITAAIGELMESAESTLDVVNPYVADRMMTGRLIEAARRGVAVRLVVPAEPNNRLCAGAQKHRHPKLLDAGVQIWEHPAMVHAKAFVRDGVDVIAGTCNLEGLSLKRSLEIDGRFRSAALARQFADGFFGPAIEASRPGTVATGTGERALNALLAAISPVL